MSAFHILRHWWETPVVYDNGSVVQALAIRRGVEPGTWCGLPMPKKHYAFEGSVRARSGKACPACVEALNRDLESRPSVVAAKQREERLERGLVACEDGEHIEESLTSSVVWCSRCGSVSIEGAAWLVPEHLYEPPPEGS